MAAHEIEIETLMLTADEGNEVPPFNFYLMPEIPLLTSGSPSKASDKRNCNHGGISLRSLFLYRPSPFPSSPD
eukprot:4914930-Pyramimonas_sp.AAC.1